MIEWLSECCEGVPMDEVDVGEFGVGWAFCYECLNYGSFFNPADDCMDAPFDTQEEKHGER